MGGGICDIEFFWRTPHTNFFCCSRKLQPFCFHLADVLFFFFLISEVNFFFFFFCLFVFSSSNWSLQFLFFSFLLCPLGVICVLLLWGVGGFHCHEFSLWQLTARENTLTLKVPIINCQNSYECAPIVLISLDKVNFKLESILKPSHYSFDAQKKSHIHTRSHKEDQRF